MRRMNRKKILQALLLAVLCCALAGCWIIGKRHEQGQAPKAEPEIPMSEEEFRENFPYLAVTRADHETDSGEAQPLDLSGQKEGSELLISGGSWILSGKMTGRIRIDAEEQTVHLILDGVNLLSKEGPAIWAESAGKVIITLKEGTENVISDAGDYRKTPDLEACIQSNADLTFNGTGALTVSGLYKDAIRSKNVVKVLDGQITLRCKRSGIHGTDGIHVTGGELDISSEKNGLRTTKNGIDGRGDLVIAGGSHRIIAGRHAFLVGRGDLYIYDCTIQEKSVVSTWNVGGEARVQGGCIQ